MENSVFWIGYHTTLAENIFATFANFRFEMAIAILLKLNVVCISGRINAWFQQAQNIFEVNYYFHPNFQGYNI